MASHPLPHETAVELERKYLNQRAIAQGLSEKMMGLERDLADLRKLVTEKNARIVRYEAENVRLKLQRTDAELAVLVEALKKEVGTKDRRLVEVERATTVMRDSEVLALRRAAEAEQKVKVLQATLETMQTARDAAERRISAAQDLADQAKDLSIVSIERAAKAAKDALVATKPWEVLVGLGYKIVQNSPSLNRNETEVKAFRKAHEELKAARTAVGPG